MYSRLGSCVTDVDHNSYCSSFVDTVRGNLFPPSNKIPLNVKVRRSTFYSIFYGINIICNTLEYIHVTGPTGVFRIMRR